MRRFGFATHVRQTCAIAGTAFGSIAKSAAGLVAVVVAVIAALLMPALVGLKGVSLLPRTAQVLTVLTAPVAENPRLPWVLIPLLIMFYAGELIWRERDAGISEISDAAPVPEWALFLGKFLGLTLVLVAWMAPCWRIIAGVLGQMRIRVTSIPEIRAVSADPLRTSTHRLRPLCTARLRGARGGESEAGRLPGGTDRIRGHRLPIHLRVGTPPAHLWIRSEVELFGHPRVRLLPRALAVVQSLLGGVGAAAGRCGNAAVAARSFRRSL